MLSTAIDRIEYALPTHTVSNEELSRNFPAWSIPRIAAKTGIESRCVALPEECASDLAVEAAQKIFSSGIVSTSEIDFVLFCTQSPDYLIPTTACLIHRRLGISPSSGALDVNLGCSGFVYALGLCDGLIQSRQAKTILLLTGDTYSKYMELGDKNSALIFGDGAAATLVRARDVAEPLIGPYVYGTDGNGANYLMLPGSGTRGRCITEKDNACSKLCIDGSKMFQFAVETVPVCVGALLQKASLKIDDIDLFFFHQANDYILEEISRRLGVSRSRVPFEASQSANTVSSTIPIAMRNALNRGAIGHGAVMMLIGFGVGLSWAGTIVRWHPVPQA